MNWHLLDIIDFLSYQGWHAVISILILSAVRPMAMLYSFTGFLWTMQRSALMRTIISMSLGLPVLVSSVPKLELVIGGFGIGLLVMLVLVEVVIGLSLGLLASLPFFSLQYAGAISDQFRGESDSGVTNPTGGTITTFGMLYVVIGFLAFAYSDGIAHLIGALYETYNLWPVGNGFPKFDINTVTAVVYLIGDSLWFAIRLTVPLLAVLGFIELASIVSARLAKRFAFYNLAFLIKNTAALAFAPIIAATVWATFNETVIVEMVAFDLRVFLGR